MCFDDLVAWDAGFALEAVYVLCEKLKEEPFLVEQVNKGVCDCRSVFPWIQLLCECVEWEWVLAEEGELEDGFWVWKIEAFEVCVQTCLWRAEVGDASRRRDTSSSLYGFF